MTVTKRISIIIAVLLILGAGAWYFFGRPSASQITETLTGVLPFGSGEGTSGASSGGNQTGSGPAGGPGVPTAHFFQISDAPVAGALAFLKHGSLTVRYVERATGHIYDVDPVSLIKTEIVNTTIPKVYEAVWKADGSAVVFRTLAADNETVISNSIALAAPSGTSTSDFYTTKTSSLAAGISELVAGQKNIFYTSKVSPQVSTALFDGSKPSTLWSSAFNQWQLAAIGDTTLILTSKASASLNGYSYKLTTKSTPTKLLGPLPGLAVMPNSDLTWIAYSYLDGARTVLAIEKLSTGDVRTIDPATLAEKCIWGTKSSTTLYCGVPITGLGSTEPDDWYKGVSHYNDLIWKFDIGSDFANVLVNPSKNFGVAIDAENLFLSPNEDYLFFQNKNDLSLWALKLE